MISKQECIASDCIQARLVTLLVGRILRPHIEAAQV